MTFVLNAINTMCIAVGAAKYGNAKESVAIRRPRVKKV